MYCTISEALSMIKADMMSVIIGDEYIEDEDERQAKIEAVASDAVSDACAEIDGYLAKRYSVPFTRTPKVLNKLAKDIAAYNMVARRGIDESSNEKTFLNRYNAAIKFLVMVAEGKASIGMDDAGDGSGGENGLGNAAADGFRMQSADRIFSRDSMRGW